MSALSEGCLALLLIFGLVAVTVGGYRPLNAAERAGWHAYQQRLAAAKRATPAQREGTNR